MKNKGNKNKNPQGGKENPENDPTRKFDPRKNDPTRKENPKENDPTRINPEWNDPEKVDPTVNQGETPETNEDSEKHKPYGRTAKDVKKSNGQKQGKDENKNK